MTDLEESQKVTIEQLKKEVQVWKTKYFDQIKTDQEWEVYIKKVESKRRSKVDKKHYFGFLVFFGFYL